VSFPRAPIESVADLQARLEAERAATPFLVFRDHEGRQRIVTLLPGPGDVAIGRDRAAEVALHWDQRVSRVHALLKHTAGAWSVVDDGLSRNGTRVNGTRIAGRRRLADRDVVGCGSVQIEFRDPSAGRAEETQQASADRRSPAGMLTPAQRRVLIALCRPLCDSPHGHPATNKAIAAELTLSVDAVKTHLRRLAVTLGVEDLPQNRKRSEMARSALASGLVTERDMPPQRT
jgi:hypothetical protein